MRHQVIELHARAPAKPAPGAPCNGCGVCCAAEPCPLGVLVSGRRHGRCAALVWHAAEDRYRCRVLDRAGGRTGRGLLARLAARWIAAGAGCDSDAEVGG